MTNTIKYPILYTFRRCPYAIRTRMVIKSSQITVEIREIELKNKIIKFRNDELHHKDIAFEEGASKQGFYGILDNIIKTGSKIAIKISEKY